jgi:hypothetical protein
MNVSFLPQRNKTQGNRTKVFKGAKVLTPRTV